MREAILQCISKGGVSFVELSREVPGFTGDNWIKNDKNMIYWSSVSDEAAQTLLDLEMQDIIKKVPCSVVTYVVDGGWLELPVVKQNRKYKQPHWLPVTYSLVK